VEGGELERWSEGGIKGGREAVGGVGIWRKRERREGGGEGWKGECELVEEEVYCMRAFTY
jgi:hypothetical protein